MDIFTSHFDEVVNLPEDCLVFASTPGCSVQAFQLGDYPVWGIQPHPEISIAEGRRFFEAIIATGVRNKDLFQTALESTPRDSGLIQPLVANFLQSFKEFPPSQKPAAFNLDRVMDQLYQTGSH